MPPITLISGLVTGVIFLTAASCSISFRSSGLLDGGPFRSSDAGEVWEQIVNAGSTEKGKPVRIDNIDIVSLTLDPSNRQTIYASTVGAGMYRSDDGGSTWVHTRQDSGTYTSFAIDPNNSSILYTASGGTMWKSPDGGASWIVVYRESQPNRTITGLAIPSLVTGSVLASTSTGNFLLSRDFGNTWQLFSQLPTADSVSSFFYASGSSSTLYALTAANGLLKSVDAGVTWNPITAGLAAFPGANTITSVASLPGKPDVLYIATHYGLLMTADGGKTWQSIQTLVPFASQPIQSVVVDPVKPQLIYIIVGNRLRKSADGGATWDAKIQVPTSRLLTTLVINPEQPSQLYLGTKRVKK